MCAAPPDHVELVEGSRIALLVPGSEAYVDLVVSLLAAGMFPVPLDPKLTGSERERIFATVRPDLVVETEADLQQMVANAPDRFRRARPRCRPMHCTSGTTGTPKGVYSGLLSDEEAEALLSEERELWGFRESDVNLVLSPLYHSAPLRFAMGTLLAGGRVVVPGPFDPASITEAIERERPTTMFCVPAHLQRLFAHWEEHGRPDLSSFRLVAHAGAPCPEQVKRRLIEAFPSRSTWEFYGSTEGQFTACRSEEWLQRPGTLGRARPGRRMFTDNTGRFWCEAPGYARFEYFGDPEKTAAAWRDTEDGGRAFTVGDLGRIDEDGYVWLDGRREDLIISGGVNVYPAEVEQVLGQAPGVTEIAVFGVDDDHWGQRVVATVVGDVTDADLAAYAREHLVAAKRPKEFRRAAALPRTPTGKVLRRQLSGE